MAIDPSTETLISLSEAAALLPRRRRGKRPHVSCVYRWTKDGCKNVILESLQCGGTRVTSKEALVRFLEALTLASPTGLQMTVRSPIKRQRAAEQAIRALEHEGV